MSKITLGPDIWKRIELLRIDSFAGLAPKFREAIVAGMNDMKGNSIRLGGILVDLDWYVFETIRLDELQQIYYAQGTTKAKTADYSWHKYGLAVDGISQRFKWFNTPAARVIWSNASKREGYALEWFLRCGEYFEKHGCKLGARWKSKDLPHVYWGKCRPTPVTAPLLWRLGGNIRVWREVGAI